MSKNLEFNDSMEGSGKGKPPLGQKRPDELITTSLEELTCESFRVLSKDRENIHVTLYLERLRYYSLQPTADSVIIVT